VHAAKVLAEAQQKAGLAVMVRLYPMELEESFVVQHAALNARMHHDLAHKDDPDEPSRASCRQMSYLLDEKSAAILFDRSRRRTRAYEVKLRRLTKASDRRSGKRRSDSRVERDLSGDGSRRLRVTLPSARLKPGRGGSCRQVVWRSRRRCRAALPDTTRRDTTHRFRP